MERWMRRGLLFGLAFTLVACGNDTTDPDVETNGTVEETVTPEESVVVSSESAEPEVVEIDGIEVGPLFRSYMEQMSEGSYFMKYRINVEVDDEKLTEIESSFAIDDDVMATETISEMGQQNMVIKDDLIYMIMHDEQLVYIMDATEGEEAAESIEEPLDMEGFNYVGSGTEEGLEFETYQYEELTYTYYFSNGELVRMVLDTPELHSEMEVVEFSDDPPSEMFVVPENYEVMDFNEVMDGLDGMIDGMDGSE